MHFIYLFRNVIVNKVNNFVPLRYISEEDDQSWYFKLLGSVSVDGLKHWPNPPLPSYSSCLGWAWVWFCLSDSKCGLKTVPTGLWVCWGSGLGVPVAQTLTIAALRPAYTRSSASPRVPCRPGGEWPDLGGVWQPWVWPLLTSHRLLLAPLTAIQHSTGLGDCRLLRVPATWMQPAGEAWTWHPVCEVPLWPSLLCNLHLSPRLLACNICHILISTLEGWCEIWWVYA